MSKLHYNLVFAWAMAACDTCDEDTVIADFPAFSDDGAGLNNVEDKRGGISTFLFAKCSWTPAGNTLTEWQQAITDGNLIKVSDCGIVGNKTTEATVVTRGSCRKDRVTDRKHTLTITDISDSVAYDRATLWQHFQANPESYKVAYWTCDGVFYPFNKVVINPNRETQDSIEGNDQVVAVCTWNKLIDDIPVTLPFGPEELKLPTPTP